MAGNATCLPDGFSVFIARADAAIPDRTRSGRYPNDEKKTYPRVALGEVKYWYPIRVL